MTPDDPAEPDLDGHSMEELADYLDDGRQPRDDSIERSAACVLALAGLERLRGMTTTMLTAAPEPRPGAVDGWMAGILARISLDSHAGRDLPLAEPTDDGALLVTEGALRSLVRAAGDRLAGALVGRVSIAGDLTSPAAEVALRVEMDVLVGVPIPAAAAQLRHEITEAVHRHTTFRSRTVDVVVRDLHFPRAAGAGQHGTDPHGADQHGADQHGADPSTLDLPAPEPQP